MTATSQASVRARFRGCLLGLTVGDALGAPYEGLTSDDIFWRFGSADRIVTNPDGDRLYYTDDTQMMIGLAETLVECGTVDEARLCKAFVENYQPERGYGRGARQIVEAMAAGEDWRTVTATVFRGGSLGNGAAMRVAPVGLLFRDDLDAVWEQARLSALPTHVHPVGIEGGQVFALAVALASRATEFDRKAFFDQLLSRVRTEEFRWAVTTARRIRPGNSVSSLGSTLHAHRSVVTAIACFAAAPNDYELAVGRAISLGDDTDTLAAMTGALCGAFAGIKGVPAERIAQLDRGPKGRGYIKRLAKQLYDRYATITTP
jgi:poly(ADP-ribose) glycohydrolase ARH3